MVLNKTVIKWLWCTEQDGRQRHSKGCPHSQIIEKCDSANNFGHNLKVLFSVHILCLSVVAQ
jgi:hypothetical protein